jgi:DNA-binding CsgD family transcriptional regulator
MRGRERYGSRDLNKTELRVVELVAQGLKNSEVAEIIGATPPTRSTKNSLTNTTSN